MMASPAGTAGKAGRRAKMREQICAPNLPIVTEQTSPSVVDSPMPKVAVAPTP
jgi:hypothetical protein